MAINPSTDQTSKEVQSFNNVKLEKKGSTVIPAKRKLVKRMIYELSVFVLSSFFQRQILQDLQQKDETKDKES